VIPLTVRLTVRPALADYPPGTGYGPRRLTDFELVWLLSGSARWRAAGRELRLAPGQVMLIPPGTEDTFTWDADVPTRHGYVHFTLPEPGGPAADTPRIAAAEPLRALLDYLVWLAGEPGPGWRRRTEEVVALVVRLVSEGPLPGPDAVAEAPAVTAALAYVHRAWQGGMRPLTMAELAAAAAVSGAHLSRQFSRAYGTGPIAALERVRLVRAATLLARSNLSVTQVGAACGFADPLHFSRRFRAVHGRSPRAYRSAGGPDDTSTPPGIRRLARRLESAGAPGTRGLESAAGTAAGQ
jgi:AraC family transcriptional regulator